MSSKIKILYVFHVSAVGGGSFCLLNIIKQLNKDIYHPIVLLKNNGPLAFELNKVGATVYFEKSITTVLYNKTIFKFHNIQLIYGIFSSLSIIKGWLKKIEPDLLHLNSMMLYPYLLPASHLKIKTIVHMRENWPKGEHEIQFKLAKWLINKYADKIVAINQTSADILDMQYKTEIIHDYISFDGRSNNFDFKKTFGKDHKSLKIFSFFGGTNWQKGALQVVETFVNKILDEDVRLLVVGGVNKNIVFNGFFGRVKKALSKVGYYRYIDKVKYIAQKDERIIFIPPTYHVKSIIEQSICIISFFSIPHANLTMAEATLLGKPSIAADTPEAKEYSNNGKSALLFKMNNKMDLEGKIIFFLQNIESIDSKAEAGVGITKSLFDPKLNSNLLNNVYQHLLGNIEPIK
jgi:glycosyltransferase involved in cell wall biosynthesis